MKRQGAALGLAMLLLIYSAAPAIAEEPPPEPDPELQDDDPADDEESPDEEPEDEDEPQADEAVASDDDDEQTDDDVAFVEDMDDDWANDVVVDESDDAIPVDLELDPTGESWEVIEFADDGDNQEEGEESATGEIRDSADMPTISRPGKRAKPRLAGTGREQTRRQRGHPVFNRRQAYPRRRRAMAGANLLSARGAEVGREDP